MSGPPPTPTALAALRGFPGHRKRNTREPTPAPLADLTPPLKLDIETTGAWNRLAPIFAKLGMLTEADVPFAQLCRGEVLLDRLWERGDEAGYLKAFSALRPLWAEFGATPASRSRIAAASDPDDGTDPIARLLAKRARRPA